MTNGFNIILVSQSISLTMMPAFSMKNCSSLATPAGTFPWSSWIPSRRRTSCPWEGSVTFSSQTTFTCHQRSFKNKDLTWISGRSSSPSSGEGTTEPAPSPAPPSRTPSTSATSWHSSGMMSPGSKSWDPVTSKRPFPSTTWMFSSMPRPLNAASKHSTASPTANSTTASSGPSNGWRQSTCLSPTGFDGPSPARTGRTTL